MRVKPTNRGPLGEPRYESATLRKVTALATRLQSAHQDTLTAREMEAIGAEVGLEPAFIQEALAQLTAEPQQRPVEKASQKEFWSLVAAWGGAWLWCMLGISVMLGWELNVPLLRFITLIAPVPLAAVLGFLAGTRKAAFWLGAALMLGLTPAFFRLNSHMLHDGHSVVLSPLLGAIGYSLGGGSLAGWIGTQGARLRRHYFPAPSARQTVSRPALLNLLFALQRQLEGQKQRRAFLSVDVVGSTALKRDASELAVEYSFGQFREWVERKVLTHGGEMQSAAGDGVMALFPSDAGAVRAARELQEELPRFNREQNRLSGPFRIRCGVSAGEVPIEEGIPIGHLHSPVIDRAAALQKRAEPGDILVSSEVTAAALLELGGLTPLPEPVAGEPAFAWRADQPDEQPALQQP
jgi:class 3 adenylate cyclase